MQKTCIIVPCYNEASRGSLVAFENALPNNDALHFCFVNDGSSDNTLAVLNDLVQHHPNASVLHLEKNQGKAAAIQQAILQIDDSFSHVGYLDADLSTPLSELERLLTFTNDEIDLVMGSRVKRIGAFVKRNPLRHIFGRILATIVNTFILKLPVYDTQCGAKIIATPLAKAIFEQPFKSKWLFDIELLLRIKALYGRTKTLEKIVEVPLNIWHDKGDSRITLMDFIKVPLEVLRIYIHYRK